MRSALPNLVAVFALLTACGGVEDPFAGDVDGADALLDSAGTTDAADPDADDANRADAEDSGRSEGVFGAPCTSATDCPSGLCEEVDGSPVCIAPCSEDADCLGGWTCTARPELNRTICGCTDAVAEAPNAEDDDCDGLVDDGLARIAFWNIRQLSTNSRDEVELSLIADVLEDYDVVGVAEVEDDAVVPELVELLVARGFPVDGFVSDPVGNSSGSTERYAVIWRTDRFALDGAELLEERLTPEGRPFDREPLLARMRAVDGFDMALLVVHVVWGGGEDERLDEVRALDGYIADARAVDPDVIVAGDLNVNVGEPTALGPLLAQNGLVDTTPATPATKVDSSNTYDHILLDPVATEEWTGDAGTDAFDTLLFPDDPDAASLAVSDHRPVWIVVATEGDDD